MDFFTLRRQVAEIKAGFAAPPAVVQAIDLAPEGFGLVLKAPEGWFCLELHLSPDHQGLWLTRAWDESPVRTQMGRTLERLARDSWLTGLALFSSPTFPADRVVQLTLTCRDRFFATRQVHHLIVELTGRVANLLACDADLVVLDQRRPTGNNAPRSPYLPPAVDGPAPAARPEEVAAVLAGPPDSWKGRLAGFSPLMTRELAFRCEGTSVPERWQIYAALLAEATAGPLPATNPQTKPGPHPGAASEQDSHRTAISGGNFLAAPPGRGEGGGKGPPVSRSEGATPPAATDHGSPPVGPVRVYREGNKIRAVVPVELRSLAGRADCLEFATVNEAMLWVDEHGVKAARLANARDQARGRFAAELAARTRLRETLLADLDRFRGADRYKSCGDLLLSHLREVPPGSPRVTLADWATGAPVEIPLDPARTVAANAQKYFRMYKKALRGVEEVTRRLAEVDGEIAWLREQVWLCENAASPADVMALPRRSRRKAAPAKAAREGKEAARRLKPLLELDGCRFYVGRNGRQNDLLTFSLARKADAWCHANDVPGSHVIVKRADGPPTDEDRRRGAVLAAHFSFARQAGKVAVDVTDVAHVRRIPGGGPGRVSYTHQKTFHVDPSEAVAWLAAAAPEGAEGENHR